MTSIYQLKPRFQALLRPLVRALARAGVTANQVTIAAVLLAVAVFPVLALIEDRRALLVLPVVLFVRMALNAIDGMLAREHGQASKLGALLNELGDVVGDALMYLPLMVRPEFNALDVLLVVFLGFLAEMAGVAAIGIGASRRYDGPFGKSDRAFAFGALALAFGLGVPPGAWLHYVFVVLYALSGVTILNRILRALEEARAREGRV
ncbi:MAG TPA: CDP-alcohol phosphatidyltransferase family protein [Rhodanobacteraceae bacterium]|nr:CDP-alcohol phosphatidyltransferase family protein [Rhodanobacteraceae bacterium]